MQTEQENFDNIFRFCGDYKKLEKTVRFGVLNPAFHQSVSAHTANMMALADRLVTVYKLDLDWNAVSRQILYHDMSERDMDYDVTIIEAATDKKKSMLKHKAELEANFRTLADYGPSVSNHIQAFENWQTDESKFAKAVDAMEAVIHIIGIGVEKLEKGEHGFVAKNAHKAVTNFPRLADFYGQLQSKLRQEYKNHGIEWKMDYYITSSPRQTRHDGGQCLPLCR